MSVIQPFYIKAALNRYCRTITVAKCPCPLSNICCLLGKPYMTNDENAIGWALKELMLIQ